MRSIILGLGYQPAQDPVREEKAVGHKVWRAKTLLPPPAQKRRSDWTANFSRPIYIYSRPERRSK